MVLSAVLSALAALSFYGLAFHLHNRVERIHPGFNEQMRRMCGVLRRMGLKRD